MEFDQHTGSSTDPEVEDATAYQRLISKLLYLTITRPGIYFSVQVLSQIMQHPKASHWKAALRILRYVKKSPRLGVLLKRVTGSTELTGYCNSDWASCPITRRSITGYMIKFGNFLVFWKSKK
ncbi:secreted RxLR effector protein 161-like [Solanum dulcamara]|uniref:secreted RxLR effector protein 161-like n=1 Tax=Solanum dulcamara TaxID=45834 RepID=UPI00248586F1|nr:secreted RxLR effector protein 161-like [Solanum dulcamara]